MKEQVDTGWVFNVVRWGLVLRSQQALKQPLTMGHQGCRNWILPYQSKETCPSEGQLPSKCSASRLGIFRLLGI